MNNSLYNFHFQNDFLYHEEKKQQHMGEIIYTLLHVLKIHCMEIRCVISVLVVIYIKMVEINCFVS
jgi:hypothetical protein